MTKTIRFGNYLREVALKQKTISYNHLVAPQQFGEDGSLLPMHRPHLKLRLVDIIRLVRPYLSVRFTDQFSAVVPLAVYLVLFQLFIIKQQISDAGTIFSGMVAVILGLMLFMEGLKVGLMPFGETIGNLLPSKASLPLVLIIAFLLGVGATLAEPAIGAIKTAGSNLDVMTSPLLYTLLHDWSGALVLIVGVGVGIAVVLGTLRCIYNWSLKPLIYCSLLPTLALTLYCMNDAALSDIVSLAWDVGGITTGPITVPLVLALGVGMAAAAGNGNSSMAGFGIVTLASIFPVLGIFLLAIYMSETLSTDVIITTAQNSVSVASTAWHQVSPGIDILNGFRAIVPLVAFLLLVLHFVLKEKVKNKLNTTYGVILCVLGMVIFNLGLTYGLSLLGGQAGGMVPAAFTMIESVSISPIYTFGFGLMVSVLFAWFLGFGATLAEPALNALGSTVENLSNGAFKKSLLMYVVAIGVGIGIAAGILLMIFNVPLAWVLVPGYGAAILLTTISTEEFVNIAWDSAGVTTGPVTVPLVLAMGLGFGSAVGGGGFGILAMASICPIIAVLCTGLWVQWRIKQREHIASSSDNKYSALVSDIGEVSN